MRTTKDKLDLMMDRFVHPDSFYARQTPDTYYQVKANGKPAVFTETHLLEHLSKKATYAPYQISTEDTVKWVCIDVDGYDTDAGTIQQVTRNVAKAVHALLGDKTALVEDSGNKGFHVWVLLKEPILTAKGYAFGHKIVSVVTPAEGIILEVYPKQKTKTPAGFGGTVKLPLGINQKTGMHCVFVDQSFTPYEDHWQRLQEAKRVPTTAIDALIHLVENRGTLRTSASSGAQEWVPLCLTQIMQEGCAEGMRDEAAFKLACYSHKKGFPEDYTLAQLTMWNERNRPPLDDAVLAQKVRSASTGQYGFKPCKNTAFDSYCSSACSYFANKMQHYGYERVEAAIGNISAD